MDSEVFAKRRAALRAQMGPGAVALVTSSREAVRNGDTEFPFRQSSDLAYLTGFLEPEAAAVISTAHAHDFSLFVRPRDPERETWTGRRAGVEGAVEVWGARAAFPVDELWTRLPEYLSEVDTLHVSLGRDADFDRELLALIGHLRGRARLKGHPPDRIEELGVLLHAQRRIKAPEELAALERAAAVTVEAHLRAMAHARPGQREFEVQAELEHVFGCRGGTAGYPPIVAAGANATVLHYIDNRAELHAGELLLIDAAAELELYTADVSRTFPVSGRFSPEQRAAYEVVLAAHQAALDLCVPGQTLPEIHRVAVRKITEGLVELGLLRGEVGALVEQGAFKRFFMHGTSHWLGMDVHDVGRYGRRGEAQKLEPGMVFTVEPGLYLPVSDDVPLAFRGIGVRIEDDVAITSEGHHNLTEALPCSIADIEAACVR